MADLKYYRTEQEEFAEPFSRNMTDTEAIYIYKRLKTKYKLQQKLVFRGREGGNCGKWEIKLQHEPSIGIMAHEVAHGLQYRHRIKGMKWHCKKHKRLMAKVLKVIEKNFNAWREMANRKANRRIESLQKKEERKKTMQEVKGTKDFRLQKLQERIKKWESKRKRAESALKKLHKKENRLLDAKQEGEVQEH
jgi:hypothetical protein